MAEPRRKLAKQEAIRHLIHTAIRLIIDMEDPFAVHVLVQSADKLLTDIAKKCGRELHVDWESYVKSEFHKQFFLKHRAIYNYFKHADKDTNDELPVHDIMRLNVITLFICVANYVKVFGEMTNHMTLLMVFAAALAPELINPREMVGSTLLSNVHSFEGMTPKEMFGAFNNISMFPHYAREVALDIQDIIDFYHLSFAELHVGKTKSHRLVRIHDYYSNS